MKTVKDLKIQYRFDTGDEPVNNFFFDFMNMDETDASKIQNYIEWLESKVLNSI